MSKVLIVSDTHGNDSLLKKIVEKEKPFDLLIHCGDLEESEGKLISICDTPVYAVAGNNDYFYDLPNRVEFDWKGKHILLTHGHYDNVYSGYDRLYYKAKELKADIVMFGHTHVPCLKTIDGVRFVNPGSLTYPRQAGRVPTYMVMENCSENESEDGYKIELKYCNV